MSSWFFREAEEEPIEKKLTLMEKIQNIDAKTAGYIRFGLNLAGFILTLGVGHLFYYGFMFINWFVGTCTGTRAAKHLSWDPFKNIPYLNPDDNAGVAPHVF